MTHTATTPTTINEIHQCLDLFFLREPELDEEAEPVEFEGDVTVFVAFGDGDLIFGFLVFLPAAVALGLATSLAA